MKNLHFYLAPIFLLCLFISCNKEQLISPNEHNIAPREKEYGKLENISHLLTYDNKTYPFSSKREMLSFLAGIEKSARYFFYEWVLLDLHGTYENKFGKDYLKDNSLLDELTQDFTDELEDEGLTISTQFLDCIVCLLQAGDCEFVYFFDKGNINLELFDKADFQGDQFELTETQFAALLYDCEQINGALEIPNLSFDGMDWNNRISSIKFNTTLRYESLLLSFYSESEMRGIAHSYLLRAFEHEKNESDLSDFLWRIQGLSIPVGNNISSISMNMTGLHPRQ